MKGASAHSHTEIWDITSIFEKSIIVGGACQTHVHASPFSKIDAGHGCGGCRSSSSWARAIRHCCGCGASANGVIGRWDIGWVSKGKFMPRPPEPGEHYVRGIEAPLWGEVAQSPSPARVNAPGFHWEHVRLTLSSTQMAANTRHHRESIARAAFAKAVGLHVLVERHPDSAPSSLQAAGSGATAPRIDGVRFARAVMALLPGPKTSLRYRSGA